MSKIAHSQSGIQRRFEEFHTENPKVYELFAALALMKLAEGYTHYSADNICHVIRWQMSKTRGQEIKINDHFTSRYARLLMEDDDRFAEFFTLRALKA